MALWLQDRYLVLPQVRSGSGTRYQEGNVIFWAKGEEALLEVDGEQLYYRAQQGADSIVVTITETECRDTMQGAVYTHTVLVQLNGCSYQGCGRSLDHPWQ